jgi:NAD(P)-dependent dehydrogenase (short-subunit alcohol dehydrogenase family)
MTLRFAQAGVTVVMLDKQERALEKLYDEVMEGGGAEPVIQPLDLASVSPGDIDELLHSVKRELGGLDLLLHCAARFEGLRPLEQYPADEWLLHLQVNLNAAWLLSSRCLPLLRQSEKGQMVFLLEDLERVRKANWGAYGVSKYALSGMVNQWVAELGGSGITVLGLNPGPFQSSLRAEAYLAEDPSTLPQPSAVAKTIYDYLQRDTLTSSAMVDLPAS